METLTSSEGDVHDGMQRFDSSSAGDAECKGHVILVSKQDGSQEFIHWASRVLKHRNRRLPLCAFCLTLQQNMLLITSLLSAVFSAGPGLVTVSCGCTGMHIRTKCKADPSFQDSSA